MCNFLFQLHSVKGVLKGFSVFSSQSKAPHGAGLTELRRKRKIICDSWGRFIGPGKQVNRAAALVSLGVQQLLL